MYRSVEWHTGSDGLLKEIAVEYEQTFWQWLLRKPATERRWRKRSGIEWWRVEKGVGNDELMFSIEDPKEVKEILMAMDYIHRQKFLQDLEERCRKILHED
jgi:hypothetical protein